MKLYLRYWMLIALIAVGCRKADVRTAPSPPPPKDRETGEVVFGCGPEAEYKGGMAEWLKFLSSNLIYPDTAVNAEVQGKIRVSFTIEKDGKVSNVEALDGPGMLRREAVRVISLSSGRWQPATMDGFAVKSYKIQPIVFQLKVD